MFVKLASETKTAVHELAARHSSCNSYCEMKVSKWALFLIGAVLVSASHRYQEPEEQYGWGGVTERPTTRSSFSSNDDAPLRVAVFMGSVREGRNVARVAKFIQRKLTETGHEVDLIDPEVVDLPLLKRPIHFYASRSQAPSELRRFNDMVKEADAYVILTPEYNRQLPPALTNLIDHLPPLSYAFKISGIVAYSTGNGGLMAAAQARGLMVEMGAPPIPLLIHIPQVDKHLDANGNPIWNEASLNQQTSKFIVQLDWFATALRRHSDNVGRPAWNSSAVSV